MTRLDEALLLDDPPAPPPGAVQPPDEYEIEGDQDRAAARVLTRVPQEHYGPDDRQGGKHSAGKYPIEPAESSRGLTFGPVGQDLPGVPRDKGRHHRGDRPRHHRLLPR